jgi:hypothetical protein
LAVAVAFAVAERAQIGISMAFMFEIFCHFFLLDILGFILSCILETQSHIQSKKKSGIKSKGKL